MEKEIVLTKRLKKALLAQVIASQEEVLILQESDRGVGVSFTGKVKHDSDDGAALVGGWYEVESPCGRIIFPLNAVVDIDKGAKGKVIIMVNFRYLAK
jgi:hypothetical protein